MMSSPGYGCLQLREVCSSHWAQVVRLSVDTSELPPGTCAGLWRLWITQKVEMRPCGTEVESRPCESMESDVLALRSSRMRKSLDNNSPSACAIRWIVSEALKQRYRPPERALRRLSIL